MDDISKLKIILRENDCPFFEDEELAFYLNENGGDFNATAYQCLIIKSESTAVVLSGFEAADSSKYFRRLAQRYRPNNSGVLEG
jgi:hypothetical protein